MHEKIEQDCARILRDVAGLGSTISALQDARLLTESIDALDIDSLTLLDFIMQVEKAYHVELDEASVNACRTIGELAALVAAAKQSVQ